MSDSKLRVMFLIQSAEWSGECLATLTLADNVVAEGGEVWFLASPSVASVLRQQFPHHVSVLTANRRVNRGYWRRAMKTFRPRVLVLSDISEILFQRLHHKYPMMDLEWLREIEGIDVVPVLSDLGIPLPLAQGKATKQNPTLANMNNPMLRFMLQMLSTILPCPLHEPGTVEGRRGIPYRNLALPVTLDNELRMKIRARFLGQEREDHGALILHTVSSWCWKFAWRLGLRLYDYLSEVLAIYLADLPKPVTVVSMSDRPVLRDMTRGSLRIVNHNLISPTEYEKLLLSSDLVLSENMGSYALAKAIGNVPAMIFVNSYTPADVIQDQRNPLRRLVLDMEQKRHGSIFPHVCYPLRAPLQQVVRGSAGNHSAFPIETMRWGHIPSSPFIKAELYGGEKTKRLFRRVLCDPDARAILQQEDRLYLERLAQLADGATVLKRIADSDPRRGTRFATPHD